MSQIARRTEAQPLKVTDDWPAEMPILEAELQLLEAHVLDILSMMVQRGD